MRRTVLDTSILCSHWRRSFVQNRKPLTAALIKKWAALLADRYDSDAIVTPILIEFMAGATNRMELAWYRAFIRCFQVIDSQSILRDDWMEALRLAERVPRDGKPRQLGDCLIRAVANRLRHDVATLDTGFPS